MKSLIISRLRLHRLARKKTLAVVAGLADMSPQHLSDIESGKIDPRLSTIERIVDALGFSLQLVPKEQVFATRKTLPGQERHTGHNHGGKDDA